jgi:hypothetical protein
MEENEIMEEIRMVSVYFVLERRVEDSWGIEQQKEAERLHRKLRSNILMHFPFVDELNDETTEGRTHQNNRRCLDIGREVATFRRFIRIPNGAIGYPHIQSKIE